MVFSPYRLFCFLLLKRAGISTVQASFMYNEMAATRKASIYDFFLANTMHDFLYSICGTKCERFSSVQVQDYPENCYISRKTKAAGLPPYRLTFIFSQHRRHDYHMAFSLPESVRRIAPPMRIDSHHAILSEKLLHLMQNKSGRASTIPLDVYFLPTQTARLPQGVFSTRICASNRSASADNSNLANLSGKLLHPRKTKRQGFHHTA